MNVYGHNLYIIIYVYIRLYLNIFLYKTFYRKFWIIGCVQQTKQIN